MHLSSLPPFLLFSYSLTLCGIQLRNISPSIIRYKCIEDAGVHSVCVWTGMNRTWMCIHLTFDSCIRLLSSSLLRFMMILQDSKSTVFFTVWLLFLFLSILGKDVDSSSARHTRIIRMKESCMEQQCNFIPKSYEVRRSSRVNGGLG